MDELDDPRRAEIGNEVSNDYSTGSRPSDNKESGAVEKWQMQDRWNGPPDRANDRGLGTDRGILVKVFGEGWQTGNNMDPVVTLDSEFGKKKGTRCST